jgi:hypothetical protein
VKNTLSQAKSNHSVRGREKLAVYVLNSNFSDKSIVMKFKLFILLALFSALSAQLFSQSRSPTFFEIKVYHFESDPQEALIDGYLKDAYLPALHKRGIKNVGVFKPVGNDTLQDKRIYVLVPFKSVAQYAELPDQLLRDEQHNASGKDYLEADYKTPPYKRIESIFIKGFDDMPYLQLPSLRNDLSKRVYELRSYEGPTERRYARKIEMFNKGGEIVLFEKLDFNAIFYGSVIAGSRMPNLMYMTSFEDMPSRDAHWKTFFASPEWKSLSAQEYYKNTVSKNDIVLLHPAHYSDF